MHLTHSHTKLHTQLQIQLHTHTHTHNYTHNYTHTTTHTLILPSTKLAFRSKFHIEARAECLVDGGLNIIPIHNRVLINPKRIKVFRGHGRDRGLVLHCIRTHRGVGRKSFGWEHVCVQNGVVDVHIRPLEVIHTCSCCMTPKISAPASHLK